MNKMLSIVNNANSFTFMFYNVGTYVRPEYLDSYTENLIYEEDPEHNPQYILHRESKTTDAFLFTESMDSYFVNVLDGSGSTKYLMSGYSYPFTWKTFCEFLLKREDNDNQFHIEDGYALEFIFTNKDRSYNSSIEKLTELNNLRVSLGTKSVDIVDGYEKIIPLEIKLDKDFELSNRTFKFTINSKTLPERVGSEEEPVNYRTLDIGQLNIQLFGVEFDRSDWECQVTYYKG